MTVQDIPADLSNSYTLSNAVAQGTGVTSYNLRLRTPVQLDGTLKLTFRDLTLGVPSCAIIIAGTPTSLTCVKSSTNIVTVTLGIANLIAAGASGEISISNLNLPSVAKMYSVEITAYSAASAPVLSTVQMVAFTSRTIIATAMSAYTVPLEASTKASLFTHFAYPKDLPASPPSASASTLVSEIRLYFVGSGATFLKTDLGFGTQTALNIPCKGYRGLVAYSGLNIVCTLFPGPTPYIKVTNYNIVTADTEMSIILPNFNNPTGSYFVTAKLLTSQNNVYNELATGTMTVTLGAASAVTRLAAVQPTSELCYTVDNRRVSQVFSLTFNLNADQAIADGNYLHITLPFYDQGYIVDSSTVTCLLNGASMPCIPIMGVDQFLLKISVGAPNNGLQFGASVQNFVTLQGLKWPRYIKTVGAVQVNVYSSTNTTVKLYSYAPMLQPWTNFFQTFKVEADKTKQGEANTNYKFTFKTLNPIPDGASIVIDLPIEYTLLASDPAVTVTYPGLPSSTTAPLSSFYSSARVTVQNIGAIPVGDFFIYLNGVKNPTTSNVLASWGVSLLYQTYLIETMTNFASFSLDEVVTPNTITLNSISSFPDNQNLLSDLSFSFTPRTPLKEGARLSIIFPAQYKLLPSRPDCQVSGQLSSFDTCTTNLNTINVKLNSVFSSGTINLKIKGVKNPIAGETDKFILQTEYDGQIVDQVDTTTKAGKTIFITPSAVECFMSEFSFDPQNEGEIATYRFGFNPRILLESSMQIIIQFPQTFDNNLGSKVTCYALQNLPGNINCKFSEKAVIISGFSPVNASDGKPIIVEIRGITNPNTVLNSDAGTVSLGVLLTGSTTFLSFVQEAGVVETVSAAGWTFFQNLQVSNLFSRFGADYLFNFTVFNSIPNTDSGGMVLIDLPIEFSLKDSPLACSVAQSKYGTPNCSVLNNRIYVQGNTQPYAGRLELTISKLLNPLQSGTSSYFYIKSYDGFKKSIIERSFYNLDPFFFTYALAGPALSVNNDMPLSIEAGTQSIDLPITLNELSSLDIIVKPTAIAGMSFIPFQVPIAIGQNAASIRISVAETVAPGDYLIEWKILNDLIPPYYSPIKPTTITVTNKKGVLISISALNDVPFGGTSLPCAFSVANAPDTGFQISVNTKFNYKGIALDKNIIYFNAGVNEGSFSVVFTDPIAASTENLATGQVEISLGGDNADIYMLNTITLYFNIIQEDITPPNILSFSLGDVTQYSVTANIKVDDVVACYYMIALAGTTVPPIFEVKNQGPPQILTTQSRYGNIFIGTSLQGTISFSGLQPSTDYVIYAYLEDRGANLNGNPGILLFTTGDKSRAVEVELQFSQSVLTDAQKGIVRRAVAFKLSLPVSNVIEKRFDVNLKQVYVAAPGKLALVISPLYTTPNFPDMLAHCALLNTPGVKAYIKSKLSSFIDTATYTLTRYPIYTPFFGLSPTTTAEARTSLAYKFTLTNYGYVYAVAVPRTSNDTKSMPSPYQIWNGFDSTNSLVSSVNVAVLEPGVEYSFTFEQLQPATTYDVYVTAGSRHPNFPDFLGSGSTVSIESATSDSTGDESTSASILKLSGLVWMGLLLSLASTLH